MQRPPTHIFSPSKSHPSRDAVKFWKNSISHFSHKKEGKIQKGQHISKKLNRQPKKHKTLERDQDILNKHKKGIVGEKDLKKRTNQLDSRPRNQEIEAGEREIFKDQNKKYTKEREVKRSMRKGLVREREQNQ